MHGIIAQNIPAMISESKSNNAQQSDTPQGVVMRTDGHKPVK